jgi:uncharacterized protein (DUF305 family)
MMGGSGGMMSGSMMGGSGGMMGSAGSMMGGSGGMMGNGMMGEVDRHFIEQMIPHHQTAIAMADLALQKAQHPEVKTLAAAIKQTQTAEIVQMRAWYRQWYGADVPATTADTGRGMMGRGHMGNCGGMGSDSDLTALAGAANFDQAFLQQMVPHHQMAVMMASMVLARGDKPELRTLAQSISTGQSAEIVQMRAWYQQWYGTALP